MTIDLAACIVATGTAASAIIIALRSNRKSDDAHDRMDAAGIPKTLPPPTQVDEKEAVKRVQHGHRTHK